MTSVENELARRGGEGLEFSFPPGCPSRGQLSEGGGAVRMLMSLAPTSPAVELVGVVLSRWGVAAGRRGVELFSG